MDRDDRPVARMDAAVTGHSRGRPAYDRFTCNTGYSASLTADRQLMTGWAQGERALRTHCRPPRFSSRLTVPPRKLTSPGIRVSRRNLRSCSSMRLDADGRHTTAEGLLAMGSNWRFRPQSRSSPPTLRCHKADVNRRPRRRLARAESFVDWSFPRCQVLEVLPRGDRVPMGVHGRTVPRGSITRPSSCAPRWSTS